MHAFIRIKRNLSVLFILVLRDHNVQLEGGQKQDSGGQEDVKFWHLQRCDNVVPRRVNHHQLGVEPLFGVVLSFSLILLSLSFAINDTELI